MIEKQNVITEKSIQEKMRPNGCFGCGQDNPFGLQVESYLSLAPRGLHGWPPDCLYGGISASLIDCHSVNTALSYAHKQAGNEEVYDRSIQMVTGTMSIRYNKPVPMEEVELRASVEKVEGRKYYIKTSLISKGLICVVGEVLAIRIDN